MIGLLIMLDTTTTFAVKQIRREIIADNRNTEAEYSLFLKRNMSQLVYKNKFTVTIIQAKIK